MMKPEDVTLLFPALRTRLIYHVPTSTYTTAVEMPDPKKCARIVEIRKPNKEKS